MEQHFFQSFFGPKQEDIDIRPKDIVNNETIIEISNNWDCILDLMERYRKGEVKQVDPVEHTCINYILSNNIDITVYKNNEEFLEKFWKLPENIQ